MCVISKGWITGHWRWHPSDSEQLRSVPRTSSAFAGTVDCNGSIPARAEGAHPWRQDLEGGREAGLDVALGPRVGDGLFNRDYPARASVGERSSVSQRVYRTSARSTSNWGRSSCGWRPVSLLGYRPPAPIAQTHVCQVALCEVISGSGRTRGAHGDGSARHPYRR